MEIQLTKEEIDMKHKLEDPNSSLSLDKFDVQDQAVSEQFIKALRKF